MCRPGATKEAVWIEIGTTIIFFLLRGDKGRNRDFQKRVLATRCSTFYYFQWSSGPNQAPMLNVMLFGIADGGANHTSLKNNNISGRLEVSHSEKVLNGKNANMRGTECLHFAFHHSAALS